VSARTRGSGAQGQVGGRADGAIGRASSGASAGWDQRAGWRSRIHRGTRVEAQRGATWPGPGHRQTDPAPVTRRRDVLAWAAMRCQLAACLIALACLAPAQDERVPSRAGDERAQRLQQTVDEQVGLVEKHAGLTFLRPPKVRATKAREWRELVRRERGLESAREVFEASVGTFGLYLPATDEVVLSPLVVAPLLQRVDDDAPRHVREGIAHQRATVVHELVHALQEQRFALPSRLARLAKTADEDLDEVRRLKFVIEGHAVLVEERIAERELGLDDFFLSGPYAGIGGDPSYATGRRYFLHLFRRGGMRAVHEKLAAPPAFDELVRVAGEPLPPEPDEEPRESGVPDDGGAGTGRHDR
jgi:hypothetical protein